MLEWLTRALQSGAGFGTLTPDRSAELMKALQTGYDVGGTTQTGGAAIRIESLEQYLAILTETEKQIVFLNHKKLATPTILTTAHEYARRTGLGDSDSQFLLEGEMPEEEEETIDRQVALCKFQGIIGAYTIVSDLVKNIVTPEVEVTNARTMSMRKVKERMMFMGNAKLGLNGVEGTEPDGLETYVTRDGTADHTINCWGSTVNQQHLKNANAVIRDYNGFATDIIMPNDVWDDYADEYLPNFQHRPADWKGGNVLNVGWKITAIETATGSLDFSGLFLYGGLTRKTPVASANAKAPSPTPTVTVASVAAGTGLWANPYPTANVTVEYRVALGNRFGESTAAVTAPASLTFAAGSTNVGRVTITNPAAGYAGIPPTYAAIYARHTPVGGSVTAWGCIGRVPITTIAGGATSLTWDDIGTDMPGTYRCWVLDFQPQVFQAPQLLPFSKIELPLLTLSKRAAYVNFWWTESKIPRRIVMVKNVGRRSA